MKKLTIILVAISFAAAAGSVLLKKSGGERCALDGIRIEPIYQVDVTDESGKTNSFCCIECARKWIASHKGEIKGVTVTDEVTGQRIDSKIALYVKSRVVTNLSTGNNIHVFADKADAERHAKEFEGELVESPF